jgi:hypothetical protein
MWMHAFFMAFPIDILFLGRGDIMIKIRSHLSPGVVPRLYLARVSRLSYLRVRQVGTETAVGDLMALEHV